MPARHAMMTAFVEWMCGEDPDRSSVKLAVTARMLRVLPLSRAPETPLAYVGAAALPFTAAYWMP